MAKALENENIPAVADIAHRLMLLAEKYDAKDISDVAKQLIDLAGTDRDLMELAMHISELMELCREKQRIYLNAKEASSTLE